MGAGEVGAALQAQDIDGLFFTGSHATGAKIAQAMGPRLVKLQLELGGKDPTYVCDDADPKIAAAMRAFAANIADEVMAAEDDRDVKDVAYKYAKDNNELSTDKLEAMRSVGASVRKAYENTGRGDWF